MIELFRFSALVGLFLLPTAALAGTGRSCTLWSDEEGPSGAKIRVIVEGDRFTWSDERGLHTADLVRRGAVNAIFADITSIYVVYGRERNGKWNFSSGPKIIHRFRHSPSQSSSSFSDCS